jgi:tetratricopeptide (TPR) repeat protein
MKRALAVVLAALFGLEATAFAQAAPRSVAQDSATQDAGARATARQLAAEGIKLFDLGQYEQALAKFDSADALVPAPTLGLRAARCLVKLGRLVEASERYLTAARMPLDKSANATLKKAQADAMTERELLVARIPTLLIIVTGARTEEPLVVTLDDHEVPAPVVGQKQIVNPGQHKVRARRGDAHAETEIVLGEGTSESVVLELHREAVPPPPPPLESHTQRTIGLASVSVGAAGLVIGAVNGALAIATQSSLVSRCPDRRCPPSAYGQADLYDAMRAISTAGFIVGGLGLAAGIPLVLTAPASTPRPSARVVVRPAFVSIEGAF